ncbi:MAG: InlB B-repeat-containing protein, partial [Ruminococcus sp.]
MKHKIKRLTGLLFVVIMVLSTISVNAANLGSEKTGAEKADLISLGTDTATVNGKEVNVGDKVTVTYYVSSDAKWEDFQGYVTYDYTGLQLESFTLPNTTSNVMTNTAQKGFLYYIGTSFSDLYDFTSEKALFIAEFTVLSAGAYNVENIWEVIDDENYESIVDGDFYDESRLSCRFETAVPSEEPETTTSEIIVTDKYTVTFKNYDGTVISTQQYSAGETVVAPTETPVKPADEQYTYTFSGWDKDIVETVNADATYTAVFTGTLNQYSVSVSYENGTVTGCPADAVDYGTSVTLTAKANEGYSFTGYYVGGTRVSSSSTYTFTVTGNTDVVAKFNQMPVSELSVSVSGGTRLKVKLGSNGVETTQSTNYKNQNVRTGQYVTLTPTGIDGYEFLYWINDSSKIVAYSEAYTFMFTGSVSLTAVYSQVSDGVITFMSGYNKINSSMCYGSADEITMPTPYSKTGYTFKFWSIDGKTECSVSDIYNASLNGNVTVKAVYEENEVYYNL